MKTVLALPLNYDHRQEGQLRGLRSVYERVEEFDYMQVAKKYSNESACRMFVESVAHVKPDWVWMQLQETDIITGQAIEAARKRSHATVFAHWMGDARQSVSKTLAEVCAVTDVTLVSSVGQLDMYEKHGAKRAEYLQIGLDWNEDVLGEPEWKPPFEVPAVVFCGNFYGDRFPGTKDRMEAVRTLADAGIDVGVVGSGWPAGVRVVGQCAVKQQHHVYKRAKVALSVSNFNDITKYYSDRLLIALASGTSVVSRYVPGLAAEFDDGHDLLAYKTPLELLVAVKNLLDDPERAKAIGTAGRQKAVAEHTWTSRFLRLMPILEQIREARAA